MAMVKLIESSQFSDVPDIGAKFAEFSSPAMSKEAESVFGRSYDSLKPTDDKYVGIHLVALGDEEHYGCFFAGAPVTTPNGMKYIEEVEIGDEVVTHTGSIAKIAKVFKTAYTGVRADIDVNSLPDSISCTGVHPFLVVHRKGFSAKTRFDLRKAGNLAGAIDAKVAEAEWVKAEELVAGDYLVIPTSYTDEALARYPDIPADFDPYACGYYLADGCLTREYRDIASKGEYKGALLTGSMSKTKVFDRIDAWLHSIGRTVPTRGRSYTSDIGIRYEVYFKEWAEWLDSTFGHDGIVKHISPVVWKWSREDRLRFLAGYFDGDGCLTDSPGTRYHGTVSVNSASRGLLMDIQRLLASVGIASSVCRGMNRASNGCFGNGDRVIFALTIGAWYARELLKYTARLYPIEREFKQSGASSMQLGHKYALVRIGNVELSEVTDTKYNFEVPGDNSYIVDVAVHNCNRNMDGFSKESCIRDHDTFVKHGHVFSHHHNDAEKDEILGAIKASAYNDKMGRIELFIWADKEKAAEGLDTLEKTGECAFSMATRVPYDVCSVCGAKRKNSSDPNMCEHIRNQLGKMAEDGKIAYMRNVVNDWFDISFVTRPADRIAYSLKVADEAHDGVATSEMLAKAAGIEAPAYLDPGLVSDKRWTLRKLAEAYDDRIREAEATPMYRATAKVASSRIDDATIETLRKMPVKQAVAFLVDSGTFLGPDDFCRYAMGPKSAEYAEVGPRSAEIGAIAREIVKEAAWLDRFDLTSGGDFDCDRFTSRASRRFTDVAKADLAVKSASFSADNILDLIAECGLETQKTAGAHIDTSDKMWFNTLDKPMLAVALKYAEYKVAALNAALNGAASGGVPNTDNREALLALVAAQDL